VHFPILDIQSLSDMWPVQAGLGFSLFCCGTMPAPGASTKCLQCLCLGLHFLLELFSVTCKCELSIKCYSQEFQCCVEFKFYSMSLL